MIRRLALILPLAGLMLVAGTLVVIACQPEPKGPEPKVVILPAAAPKSLIVWLEYEETYRETAWRDESSTKPVLFYAGSARRENLIAERPSAGKLIWGPMALDTAYEVAWRGAGEVHIRVPAAATEAQVEEWTAEVQRCEPGVVVLTQSSDAP
jgi:hypothetical protein